MAVIPSVVIVPPDSTGASIDNVDVTTTVGAGIKRQGAFLGDPENGAARTRVTAAEPSTADYGLAVRQVPDTIYDSGIVALTDTIAVLTANSVKVETLLLVNITDLNITVTVTNTAGTHYLSQRVLGARETLVLEMGNILMVGIKWNASANGSINGQIRGR